jgi:hypothetical protein
MQKDDNDIIDKTDSLSKLIVKNLENIKKLAQKEGISLNKLINITDGTLYLDFLKSNKVYNKLTVYDGKYTLEYSLADLMLIPKTPSINDPGQYDIEVNLTLDNINSFIKAKNALPDADMVIIRDTIGFEGGDEVVLTIGDQTDFSNKISFKFSDIIINSPGGSELCFDANVLKEIFSSNKTDQAKALISREGLMKLIFTDGDINSYYYLVQKETY